MQRDPDSEHWGHLKQESPSSVSQFSPFKQTETPVHRIQIYLLISENMWSECGALLYSIVTENGHCSNIKPLTLTAWTSVTSYTCSQNVVAAPTWRFPCWELLCCPNAVPLSVTFRPCWIFFMHQFCFHLNDTRLIAKVLRAEALSDHQMASCLRSRSG